MWPRGGQDAEEFGSGQEFPPLCTDFLHKSLQDVLQKIEMPLAAGLAAGAGGLGSLEALAVHPWAQEFLHAANLHRNIIVANLPVLPPVCSGEDRQFMHSPWA